MSYTKQDLIPFNAMFGRRIDQSPSIFPAFPFYYQDIGPGGTVFGNLTLLNGEPMFPPGQEPVYPDFKWKWFINGLEKSQKPKPTLDDLRPECDGVVELTLEVKHLPTGTAWTRTEWVYLGYNGIDTCDPVVGQPGQFGVFGEYYPDVDPNVVYGKLDYDFNNDGIVNINDLQILLSLIKPQENQ